MSWLLYRWTWCLESPLYVGMPPAGSVNRCRLYVPARAVWGAVTAEIARANAGSDFSPAYDDVGEQLRKHTRFTYLFPAERVNGDWRAWLPCYVSEQGLVWEREDDRARRLRDREFRARLLSTRPSTAIEPSSDTAAEASLRETECINTRWRDQDGQVGGPVGLVGYILIHKDLDDAVRKSLEQIKAIMAGGDARYGLGQLRRWNEIAEDRVVFGCEVDLGQEDPVVSSKRVLAHAEVKAHAEPREGASSDPCGDKNSACGDKEVLRGWDYGSSDPWHVKNPLWVPGSCFTDPRHWGISDSGVWDEACVTDQESLEEPTRPAGQAPACL